jgi:hypothetical protein
MTAIAACRTCGTEPRQGARFCDGRKGETMTTAAMVTYAYDQIDQARAELNAVLKQTTSVTRESLSQKTSIR